MQNGFVESFDGPMRDELLDETLLRNMAQARSMIVDAVTKTYQQLIVQPLTDQFHSSGPSPIAD